MFLSVCNLWVNFYRDVKFKFNSFHLTRSGQYLSNFKILLRIYISKVRNMWRQGCLNQEFSPRTVLRNGTLKIPGYPCKLKFIDHFFLTMSTDRVQATHSPPSSCTGKQWTYPSKIISYWRSFTSIVYLVIRLVMSNFLHSMKWFCPWTVTNTLISSG